MARPNKRRDVFAERHLATRIAREREHRGWSYEGLADRMSKAGCAINASALYKIEHGDPPRRITVDELVALSAVLGVPMADLVVDPDLQASGRVVELLEEYFRVTAQRMRLVQESGARLDELKEQIAAAASTPAALEALKGYLSEQLAASGWDDRFYDYFTEGK